MRVKSIFTKGDLAETFVAGIERSKQTNNISFSQFFIKVEKVLTLGLSPG